MKCRSSLFTALVCLSIIGNRAYAQLEIGIAAGYNKNYLHTSTGYRSFTKYTALSGFEIALPIRYQLHDWLSLQAEPGYIQKNYMLSRDHFFEGIYQKTTNSYIQLPVLSHFSFGGKQMKGFLNLGGYGAYWAAGRVKGAVANAFDNAQGDPDNEQIYRYFQYNQAYHYNEPYAFDKRRDRRLELGLLAGIGMKYHIGNKYSFFIEGRYYYALSDQQKNYMINQIPRYNDTYMLQAGCLFNIKNIFGTGKDKLVQHN